MNLSMMDAIIVAGGDIEDDFALGFLNSQKKSPFLVAADRGFGFFMRNGVVPDVVIGDFDSASSEMKSEIEKMKNTGKTKNGRSLKVVKLRPEKDDTDTHAAVLAAKESGAVNVAVLGVFGGRIDHLMANIGLLPIMEEMGMHGVLLDSRNQVCLVKSGTVIGPGEQTGSYVSFFPIGGTAEGVSLTGFKYPLKDRDLGILESSLTVSNEFTGVPAKIEYKSGRLLMIRSGDKNVLV